MGATSAINKPLRTVDKKKRSGCRSLKTLRRKERMKKRRKVTWKKLILPKMDIDDDNDDTQQASNPTQTRPLTGKKKRKLRKKMAHLIRSQENKMEGVQNIKSDETPPAGDEAAARDGDAEMQEDE